MNEKIYDIAVVGGGPAGLSCAITAAQRGHNVTLFEKNNKALCIPCYLDSEKDLEIILNTEIKENNISLSRESINLEQASTPPAIPKLKIPDAFELVIFLQFS